MTTDVTILNALLDLKSAVGELSAGTASHKEQIQAARSEMKELRTSIETLAVSVEDLSDRLHPVEKAMSDYSSTKSSVLRTLAFIGIGNIGMGAMGAAFFNRLLGGGP